MDSTMTGPLKLDGIVRVSKTGDRKYLRSPEQQEKDVRRWAKERGHEIAHVHVAIDQTGRKRHGHPAIEAAKQRALSGVVDGVVAPYVSRFSRNTLYGLITVRDLLDAGRYSSRSTARSRICSPEGKKYLTDKLADAEYEGDVKAANFARGVEESIERGVHLQARYGYRKSNGGGSELAIVPAEAKQVERAFELRSQGFSWEAIADRMNASGAKPRPYKRDGVVQQAVWTHKTVRQLVVGQGPDKDRSVYLGMAWNGHTCSRTTPRDRHRRAVRRSERHPRHEVLQPGRPGQGAPAEGTGVLQRVRLPDDVRERLRALPGGAARRGALPGAGELPGARARRDRLEPVRAPAPRRGQVRADRGHQRPRAGGEGPPGGGGAHRRAGQEAVPAGRQSER